MLPLITLIGVLVAVPTIALSIVAFKLISLLGRSHGVAKEVSPFFHAENESSSKLEKELKDVYYRLDACYDRIEYLEELDARQTSDQRPTEDENPSEYFFDENELYGNAEELINPELVEKNRLHDEKINRIKEELATAQAGIIYNLDHDDVDKRYPPKPVHEYTE